MIWSLDSPRINDYDDESMGILAWIAYGAGFYTPEMENTPFGPNLQLIEAPEATVSISGVKSCAATLYGVE